VEVAVKFFKHRLQAQVATTKGAAFVEVQQRRTEDKFTFNQLVMMSIMLKFPISADTNISNS
jgi:hypothetical protein